MKCEKCGTEFEGNFCNNCGTKYSESSEKPADYYEALKKIESEKEEKNKKSKKKKLIGCSIPIIILVVLIVVGCVKISNFFKLSSTENEKAQEINFSEVYAEYVVNATSASQKYEGKKFIFYFTPYEIGTSGSCQGTLYDSNKIKWNMYNNDDERISWRWEIELGDDAKSVMKGQTYKIEGIFHVTYDDEDKEFCSNSIGNAKIISLEGNID